MRRFLTFSVTNLILLTLMFNTTYSSTISELTQEKNDIANKTSEVKESLNEVQSEKDSVLEQVEKLDQELTNSQKEVDNLNAQLEITKQQLERSEQELKEATELKEIQYETLKKRMRSMYEQKNSGYLEFLLGSTNFTDFLKSIEYINAIVEYDEELLAKYEETEELIQKKVQDITTQKENIETLTKEQEAKQAELLESISEKEALIVQLTSQEETYLQQIEDLKKEDQAITALIKAQTTTNSATTFSGTLQYPVPAYRGYNYNSPYGPRINPISHTSEFHTGVDLKATLGTDIVAAESGTVIFSGVRGGYGNTVIIDHGNNMTTLYAHNSSLVVKAGDTVTRGQVIAKAGSTGYSTGVHLHFEVRINGSHVDPAPYIGH